MVIKPFKVAPKPPEEFETTSLATLEEAVEAVYARKPVKASQEELYRSVESLCMHKNGPQVYERLYKQIDTHIQQTLEQLSTLCKNTEAEDFLSHVHTAWTDHTNHMMTIQCMYLYLDRTFLIQSTSEIRSLHHMGLFLFRTHFLSPKMQDVEFKTKQGLLLLIENERNGESISRSRVKELVRMFVSLNLYQDPFENQFLRHTLNYYQKEAQQRMESSGVSEYLSHVDKRITAERDRCASYLDIRTSRPLIQLLQREFITAYSTKILETGFEELMNMNKITELSLLYKLLEDVSLLGELEKTFLLYMKKAG